MPYNVDITNELILNVKQNKGGVYLKWHANSNEFYLFENETAEIFTASANGMYQLNSSDFENSKRIIDFSQTSSIKIFFEAPIDEAEAFKTLFTSTKVYIYSEIKNPNALIGNTFAFLPCTVQLETWEQLSKKLIIKVGFSINLVNYE